MRKYLALLAALAAAVALAACAPAATETPTATQDAQSEVRQVVEDFGTRLQNVSLLAPDAAEQMETHYDSLVTPELLAEWQADPANAPGRQTSSPWPERIEVQSIRRLDSGAYQVIAEVVEATSDDPDVHRQPVEIRVIRMNGVWLISDWSLTSNAP